MSITDAKSLYSIIYEYFMENILMEIRSMKAWYRKAYRAIWFLGLFLALFGAAQAANPPSADLTQVMAPSELNLQKDFPKATAWLSDPKNFQGTTPCHFYTYEEFFVGSPEKPAIFPGPSGAPDIGFFMTLFNPAAGTNGKLNIGKQWSMVQVTQHRSDAGNVYYLRNNPDTEVMDYFAKKSDNVVIPYDYAINYVQSSNMMDAWYYYYYVTAANLARWEKLF
jgi:hypothetical protein